MYLYDCRAVVCACRVLIGAPRGTYPGGLNLTDPGSPASPNTGLVYSCPVGQGQCEGVRGNTSRYIGQDLNLTNGVQDVVSTSSDFFIQPIAEGRLFDQARKYIRIYIAGCEVVINLSLRYGVPI